MINSNKNYYQLAGQAYNRASSYIDKLAKPSAKLANIDSVSLNNSQNTQISDKTNIQDVNTAYSSQQTTAVSSPNFAANLLRMPNKIMASGSGKSGGDMLRPNPFAGSYAQNEMQSSAQSIFPKMLRRKIDQLRGAEAYALAESKGNASLVQVVKHINDAEVKLTQVMNIRDKLVNGILEIFKMPL